MTRLSCEEIVPELSIPLEINDSGLPEPVVVIVPLLLSMPFTSMRTLPALAPMSPAFLTPTPASVPTRWILPAYIPPKAATSMEK